MTTVSKNAAPVKTHRSKAKAEATRRGLLYALPDWLMIIMLFFVPIVLLVIMAGSRWSLMGGNRGWNFPENFVKVFENKLLGQSVLFTLEYTVIVTIFLLVLGLGLALIVQESTKWNNMLRTCFLLPSATGLASASLLFYALYSPQVGPVTKILSFFGLMDEGGSVLATGQSALWATIIVIVWRFSGYYMLLMMIGLHAIHFALGGVDVIRPFDLEAGFFEPKACEAYSGKEFEGLWACLAGSRVRAIVVHAPTLPRA